MAFRNLMIESPARISLKNDQLMIHTHRDFSVPVEDISALLLESRQSTITTAALSFLGQSGCCVYICDEKHMPCAVLTPFGQHSRELPVLRRQLEATEPRKKQLWQAIVKAKVAAQAECLSLCGKTDRAQSLRAMIPRVRSGDTSNVEAIAAQSYFPALFGEDFIRNDGSGTNAALNYGYAILRGAIARSLCVYGFLPALGLHHRSTLNSFNLADDLMEPFRPVVDLLVITVFPEEGPLTPERKRLLFNCLNLDILSGGQRHSVAYAMERLVHSLNRCLETPECTLYLPELLPLRQHSYE